MEATYPTRLHILRPLNSTQNMQKPSGQRSPEQCPNSRSCAVGCRRSTSNSAALRSASDVALRGSSRASKKAGSSPIRVGFRRSDVHCDSANASRPAGRLAPNSAGEVLHPARSSGRVFVGEGRAVCPPDQLVSPLTAFFALLGLERPGRLRGAERSKVDLT